ncbi:hypothetical protein ACLK1U_03435 [Escherichia coli]
MIRKDGLRTGKLLSSLKVTLSDSSAISANSSLISADLALSSSVAINSTGLVNFSKVSLELSFHICVEHVYLLGFKHHHASGLCGYLDAACIMVRGRKSGAAAPD